jgi:transcription antitermination factor NusG
MIWYAVSISREAMKPRAVMRREGRRVLFEPGIEPRFEAAARQAGIGWYIPIERKMIVDRKTKKQVWRAFPIIAGFGFVHGVADFMAVEKLDGVKGIVRSASNVPLIIPEREIDNLRLSEAAINQGHIDRAAAYLASLNRKTRKAIASAYPAGTRVKVVSGVLQGQVATISEATGRQTVKAMVALLGGQVQVEIAVDDLEAA